MAFGFVVAQIERERPAFDGRVVSVKQFVGEVLRAVEQTRVGQSLRRLMRHAL